MPHPGVAGDERSEPPDCGTLGARCARPEPPGTSRNHASPFGGARPCDAARLATGGNHQTAPRRIGRRTLLRTAAAACAVPYFIPTTVLGRPGHPGANDRISLGLVGAGYRARDLLAESPADLHLVAAADCDRRQIAACLAAAGQANPAVAAEDCAQYQDYREMLDQVKLDAVMVATTTHARTLICLDAMQAGLDVYAEKPLTLTIEEGQYLVRAEQQYARICQVGTQQRSIAINNFGSDLVRSGAIGKILTVKCPNFPGPRPRPALPAAPVPAEMDWDLWCNQTELTEYSDELHPGLGKWARFREYCGWLVTGWVHAFDQVQRALGTDDTGPVEIWPEEPGPDARVSLRYASGTVLKLDMPEDQGPRMGGIFVGERGKIEINRNRLASNPPDLIRDAPPPADKSEYASVSHEHIQNWVSCMRTRTLTVAPFSVGHRAMTICHLINICRELGRPLRWDPVREEFGDDAPANALRSRARRAGYELPRLG
ncbi:MAG: Gfo/Idh/MocA family oxidoreductase [Pirellulaceae bacterium]|nr:Gfo/Idh/MocA family oxidoreductase [Pirellulaceae bacterium]